MKCDGSRLLEHAFPSGSGTSTKISSFRVGYRNALF